jgi:hypothetical protein
MEYRISISSSPMTGAFPAPGDVFDAFIYISVADIV